MITYGCQTYTWQMNLDRYQDELTSILDVIQQSGFHGVEAEVCMLGAYYEEPAKFSKSLQARGLQLAALTLAEPWLHMEETPEERANADKLIRFLQCFPEAKLILVQLPGEDRSNLAFRQQTAIACANAVGKRAYEAGITTAYHPNSPSGSVFRTEEDYRILFAGLDDRYVGYCPDSGHIARGGMDPIQLFTEQMSQIKHVHFKDYNMHIGEWRTMGKGTLAHPELVALLKQSGYQGWIMVEEESVYAETHPNEATRENGRYVSQLG
ncbi:sugar phosphate isomerase/epimerase family protein [Paenibacillus qinlingensis]|uniref:sugar phosphate isomerase/epimerase family protein n=1 Tax=Paenibacillus qinlingensis TaxID=1837343 RepID=UPI0015655EA3|nr:sugar phosphate isomerase/epimerase [Paenibacillus qinlingensis]NQX60736.1 sugar phosphate isomerase/epimerase [Paenibacillus qinlingensis]